MSSPNPMQGGPMGSRPNVPNHLVWAILCTLFCCLPGGIVAIIYASKVDGLVAAGDVAGAQAASDSAKMWCMISAGVGAVFAILWVCLSVFGAIASHH